MNTVEVPVQVRDTKQFRVDLDVVLSQLRQASGNIPKNSEASRVQAEIRSSRERSIAITKIQEAIMWLGMDLKAMREEGMPGCENPYPASYDPNSPTIEKTAQGLTL